jgi:subtilisin family serine protease
MKSDVRTPALFLLCSLVVSGCGGGANGRSTPSVPLAGAPPMRANAAGPVPAGEVTVAAVDAPNVDVDGFVNGVKRKLPYRFQPRYSNAPYTVYFDSRTAIGTGRRQKSVTYTLQTSGQKRTIYYNPLRDVQGTVGAIAPIASAFARKPAAAHVALAPLAGTPHGPDIVPNQLYVTYDRSTLERGHVLARDAELRSRVVSPGEDLLSAVPSRLLRSVTILPGVERDRALAVLRAIPGVVAVDPVHYSYLNGADARIDPNDLGYRQGDQWYVDAIGAPDAWNITRGNRSVTVGIVDTGIDAHNLDFAGKLVGGESVIQGKRTIGLAASQDEGGHGTHVAGITAAATDNGIGFAGIGYNVKLRAYRVFPNASEGGGGGASNVDISIAIRDALSDGNTAINMSLGSSPIQGNDVGTANAVAAALKGGMIVVAAAGNEAEPTVGNPANLPGVISVGASALNDLAKPAFEYVSSFSNYGPDLTLVAPGGDAGPFAKPVEPNHGIDNLWTTTEDGAAACTQDPHAVTGCGYKIIQGTSMASPVVAGVVALMRSKNPSLTPAQVKSILQQTADDIGDPREAAGRLDAYRAVAAAAGIAPPVVPQYHNLLAFAYTVNPGSNVPQILDRTYPAGIRVGGNGVFRLPDIGPKPKSYSVGLWYDTNADGIVDKGDWFGSVPCTQSRTEIATCLVGGIAVSRVKAGFVLH